MSELWREKTSFQHPSDGFKDIAYFLPYKRLYETLTPEQLRELLRDAKRLRWEVLDLHRCGLETLPPELGDLPDLRILDLGNEHWGDNDKFKESKKNTFSVLPDSIGNLSHLQRLDFANTEITVLPDFIGNLSHLQRLDLTDTGITTLPDSMGNLSHLQRLQFHNTPLFKLESEKFVWQKGIRIPL